MLGRSKLKIQPYKRTLYIETAAVVTLKKLAIADKRSASQFVEDMILDAKRRMMRKNVAYLFRVRLLSGADQLQRDRKIIRIELPMKIVPEFAQ